MVPEQKTLGTTIVEAPIKILRDAGGEGAYPCKVVALPASDDLFRRSQAKYRLVGGDVTLRSARSSISAEIKLCKQTSGGRERPPRAV